MPTGDRPTALPQRPTAIASPDQPRPTGVTAADSGDAPWREDPDHQRGSWRDETIVPTRPDRPASVEVAAAILIGVGSFGLLALVFIVASPGAVDISPSLAAAEAILQLTTVLVGLIVRTGRSWLVAVNMTAILTFLQLLGGTSISLIFTLMFGLAFGLIWARKPWFDAMRTWRRQQPEWRR